MIPTIKSISEPPSQAQLTYMQDLLNRLDSCTEKAVTQEFVRNKGEKLTKSQVTAIISQLQAWISGSKSN